MNPLYGLDSYTGQFTRPAGAAANNLYNLADFMLGLRSQYALSTFLVANMRAGPALRLRAGRHPRQRQADAQRRPALRVRDADVGGQQPADELRSGHQDDGHGDGRIDLRPRAGQSRSQQLRAASRLRLHADGRRPSSAAAGASATCTSTASDRRNLLGINGPQVVRAAVNQTTRRRRASVPTEAGLSRPASPIRRRSTR